MSLASTTATALSNLILVTPQTTVGYQPQLKGQTTAQGKALLFHYEGEQSATLESDITDHFVEDNTAIQDQISLKPETITTNGFIGDLNNVVPAALQPLQAAATKLGSISAYTPGFSETALLAFNEAAFAYQLAVNVASSAISSWQSVNGGGEAVVGSSGITNTGLASQSPQQIAFQQFYAYWKNRTLFTVQTPWAIFQNMAIKTLRAVQSAETNVITDFEVTFKIMRFATTNVQFSQSVQGQLNSQGALPVYSQEGLTTSDVSFGYGAA